MVSEQVVRLDRAAGHADDRSPALDFQSQAQVVGYAQWTPVGLPAMA